jgi:hypothetical protein
VDPKTQVADAGKEDGSVLTFLVSARRSFELEMIETACGVTVCDIRFDFSMEMQRMRTESERTTHC